MNIEIRSDVIITDDFGFVMDSLDPDVEAKIKSMHNEFKKNIERYVKSKLHQPDESDYDRAMGVL